METNELLRSHMVDDDLERERLSRLNLMGPPAGQMGQTGQTGHSQNRGAVNITYEPHVGAWGQGGVGGAAWRGGIASRRRMRRCMTKIQ